MVRQTPGPPPPPPTFRAKAIIALGIFAALGIVAFSFLMDAHIVPDKWITVHNGYIQSIFFSLIWLILLFIIRKRRPHPRLLEASLFLTILYPVFCMVWFTSPEYSGK